MTLSRLASLADHAPLHVLLVDAGGAASLALAGVAEPMRLAAQALGEGRLRVDIISAEALLRAQSLPLAHVALLIASDGSPPPPVDQLRTLVSLCSSAEVWGAVGPAVLWMARTGVMEGVRVALPWALYSDVDEVAERAILTSNLFEFDGNRLTCCGGAASIDFTLTLLECLYGADLQAQVKESLCIDRVRPGSERQRVALQARFGGLQPKLSEAVALMEANIEEPLSTDDIATLVAISRRQLERLFKQHLNSVPSRYYLELRLKRARQLLLESSHSIVQVGLMCGFSSGSHFSTSYGALFGITPRDERQRKLAPRS
ncbi:helix-turn-helix domain-containing protein [Oxalobacteraceae bacterium OM1]|nr:helix-turn-helix domain-containing protein [Oxalobacteraceae bacterium OM1]